MSNVRNYGITKDNKDQSCKIGIVSRDYNVCFPNGYRDFSYVMSDVLRLLDKKGCNVVLFSSYSLIPRSGYSLFPIIESLANIRMICFEEFCGQKNGRKEGKYVVLRKAVDEWQEYRFFQAFGRINWAREKDILLQFINKKLPQRVFGSTCLILCGESNGVKYNPKGNKDISDPCGLLESIPPSVHVILNPVHDRMSRFEMKMKRCFLSQGNRWVISVWNSGKIYIDGKTRDGKKPPWTVYRDGREVPVCSIENNLGVKIGIVDVMPAIS